MSYDVIVQYYDAVVEVCLCAANQKDPQELALHHYKSGHPESDVQGRSALNDRCALIENLLISMHEYNVCRMTCYKHITDMLQQLLNASQSPAPPTHSPIKPGPPSQNSANQNQQQANPKQQVNLLLHKVIIYMVVLIYRKFCHMNLFYCDHVF